MALKHRKRPAKRKADIKRETVGKTRAKGLERRKSPAKKTALPKGKAAPAKKPMAAPGGRELEKKQVVELRALARRMGAAERKAGTIEEITGKAPLTYKEEGDHEAKKMEPPEYRPGPGAARGKPLSAGKEHRELQPVIGEEPEEGRRYGPAIVRALPERDIMTAIAVEPGQLFVFWELAEKTARKGQPAMRVYDVTGGKAGGHFDIRLPGRTGGIYIGVLPGREYVVQAGVVGPGGRFVSARKSRKVSSPPALPSGEKAALPERYFRFQPVRYRG